jgi:hypothetical protein
MASRPGLNLVPMLLDLIRHPAPTDRYGVFLLTGHRTRH